MFEVTCSKVKEDGKRYQFKYTCHTKDKALSVAERLRAQEYDNVSVISDKDVGISEENMEFLSNICEKDETLSKLVPTEDETY